MSINLALFLYLVLTSNVNLLYIDAFGILWIAYSVT